MLFVVHLMIYIYGYYISAKISTFCTFALFVGNIQIFWCSASLIFTHNWTNNFQYDKSDEETKTHALFWSTFVSAIKHAITAQPIILLQVFLVRYSSCFATTSSNSTENKQWCCHCDCTEKLADAKEHNHQHTTASTCSAY